jgi:hypothetical protein
VDLPPVLRREPHVGQHLVSRSLQEGHRLREPPLEHRTDLLKLPLGSVVIRLREDGTHQSRHHGVGLLGHPLEEVTHE